MMRPIRLQYRDGRWGQVHLRLVDGGMVRPPLLMLHQTPKSGWIWEPLFAALAVRRTLIAPDTPGYGASAAPRLQPSIEEYALEMLALMDGLAADGLISPGAFDVIGYHTGSVIAAAIAAIAPHRVRRIALVSLAAYSADVRSAKQAALPDCPTLRADGSHLLDLWRVIDGFTDSRASLGWKQASLTENLRAGTGMYAGYRAVYTYDLEAALDALPHETMILNPQDDLFEPTRCAAARVPHARYIELPGAGHGLFAIETDRIANLISAFLDG